MIDAFAATGWHHQTISTGTYEAIEPGKLRIIESFGSTVLDYHVDSTRLVVSEYGLAAVLGGHEPAQTLDKAAQR